MSTPVTETASSQDTALPEETVFPEDAALAADTALPEDSARPEDTALPDDPERTEGSAAKIVTAAVVAAATLFVLVQIRPSLVLANTTAAGGDMGAHVWLPAYLRDHLLTHGRITGWTPDWYAGFPVLTFYFPLPSLLIVLLDVLLPYNVAFKVISVAGVLTLPAAAWAFGRLAGMRFPGPACLAVATVPFLFDRSFTIYGGNLPSTLAGEFAFSISLSLALLFLGVVARGLDDGRHRATAAVLLALTALCHVIPTFFALAGCAVLLLFRLDRRRIWWLFGVGIVAGLLAAFWMVPFLARLAYSNDMGWEKIVTYRKDLFPASLRWVPVLAALGGAAALARRRRTGAVLVILAGVAAAAFVLAPQGRLWNARVLPFWFLCLYLLCGVALAELGHFVADVRDWRAASLALTRGPETEGGRRPAPAGDRGWPRSPELLAPVAALVAALTFVAVPLQVLPAWFPLRSNDRSFIPDWVRWNYSGYERKGAFLEYRDLVTTMATIGRDVGCGRAMWEYEPELNRFGTPMALMLLPHWTDGCIGSMEGLFFESSATTPYHFLNQSELSKAPSRAQRDLPYRDLDVANGVEHLQLLGVRYYMALTPEAKAQAEGQPDLRYLASSGPWSVSDYAGGPQDRTWDIYEVAGSSIVAPLRYEPVVLDGVAKGGRQWLDAAVRWYQDDARWDVPLAAGGPPTWSRVGYRPTASSRSGTIGSTFAGETQPEPARTKVRAAKVTKVRSNDDSISFDVDRPGSPVLVKASYFPNWKATGADGPWRVTPNLMVVVPTSRHVTLRYGHTPVDGAAWVMTVFGLAGAVWLARRGTLVYRRRPQSDGASDADAAVATTAGDA